MSFSYSKWVLLGSLAALLFALVISSALYDWQELEELASAEDVVIKDLPELPNTSALQRFAALKDTCFKMGYLRWLWWPVILYLFWGMGFICDNYFVRTIEVIAERFQIPDDVAGATLMALGCNGPELALNTISIFHPSDIGVGAVIGGEVFNVLVIIGTALLATPAMYMPLKVGVFSFTRDVSFYVISVILLYVILRDQKVSIPEALMLLSGAVFYSLTVTFSTPLRDFFDRIGLGILGHLDKLGGHMASLRQRHANPVDLNDSESDSDEDHEMKQLKKAECLGQWLAACKSTDPTQGSVLGLRAEVHSRIADRSHHFEQRYVLLKDNSLLVSAAVGPQQNTKMHVTDHIEDNMVYDHDSHTKHHHWHYGGLVNQLIYLNDPSAADIMSLRQRSTSGPSGSETPGKQGSQGSVTSAMEESAATPQGGALAPLLTKREASPSRNKSAESTKTEELPVTVTTCDLMDAPWEVIPLEDVLYIEPPDDPEHLVFTLHVHQHDSHLGTMITLELEAADDSVMDAWVNEVTVNIKKLRRNNADIAEKQLIDDVVEWVEWFQFPIKYALRMTIPDMDNHSKQHLYPLSFCSSMAWLALFAYFVTAACDGLHDDFGISTTVLGFTLAAAGTSFPNVFSGMVVAQQGKTTMAIANALGANVQNVFLALAIPWTIRSLQSPTGQFKLLVKDLRGSIVMCFITLLPVLFVVWCSKFQIPKWSGALFLITYGVYLVFALGQEITDCGWWPVLQLCAGKVIIP